MKSISKREHVTEGRRQETFAKKKHHFTYLKFINVGKFLNYYDFDAVPGGGKRQDRWPNCGISARCYQEVVSSNPSYGHNADGIWKRADTDGSFTFDAAKCYQILIKVYRKNTC